jgi:hypothetical protein
VSFGVSTRSAHLDVRTSGGPSPKEIDWTAFTAWNGNKVPDFAGRYFHGAPYLWAHGEGGSLSADGTAVKRVAPIQRAVKARQEATGDDGAEFGEQDGSAIGDYVGGCVFIEELEPATDFVRVYLEVEDGTALSPDYWTAWCIALFNKLVTGSRPSAGGATVPRLMFPFLPCVLCSFAKDAGTGKYKPPNGVTTALDNAGVSVTGRRARCYGFWARAYDNAAYHAPQPALDWTAFDSYQQKLGLKTEPVPVVIWRHMNEPDPVAPVPAAVRRLSLDATHVDAGKDLAFDSMLVIRSWERELPTQVGVDKGGDLSGEISCLTRTKMTLNNLPDTSLPGIPLLTPLEGKTSFACRYYSTPDSQSNKNRKDLSASEALTLGRAGVEIVGIWQADVPYQDVRPGVIDIPAYLVNADNGKSDAKNAFLYASKRIGQPAYTPVYFAIDCNVISSGIDPPPEGPRMVPTPAQVKAYFEKVAEGYAEYLADQGTNAVPYYTGVYACSTALDLLYIEGLASHFWQAMPPSWGDGPGGTRPNVDQWPHSNMWQVAGHPSPGFLNSGVLPCRQTSEWELRIGPEATGGTFKIKIEAVETGPIPLGSSAAQVANLVAAKLPGQTVTGKDPDTPPANGTHIWTLFISGQVDSLDLVASALTGPAPGGTVRVETEQNFTGFVILDVAWGDPGGWTLR